MIKNLLQNYIKDYKITLTENQYEQFQKYFELLVEWNEKMNLPQLQTRAVWHSNILLTALACSTLLTFRRTAVLPMSVQVRVFRVLF